MSSLHIEICEELVELINGAQSTWEAIITPSGWTPAERRYENALGQLSEGIRRSEITVSVVPVTQRWKRGTRTKMDREHDIAVVVQYWPSVADNAKVDPLLNLSESLAEFIADPTRANLTLDSGNVANRMELDIDPMYDRDLLQKSGEFLFLSIHTYLVTK